MLDFPYSSDDSTVMHMQVVLTGVSGFSKGVYELRRGKCGEEFKRKNGADTLIIHCRNEFSKTQIDRNTEKDRDNFLYIYIVLLSFVI